MVAKFLRRNTASSKRCLIAGFVALISAPAPSYADSADGVGRHDAVVAAIAYNFARFIQWRNLSEEEEQANLIFCILDEDASQAWGDINGKVVGARRIELHFASGAATPHQQCDIAYVSEQLQKSLSLETLAQSGVVTISDSNSFLRNGGAIALSVSDKGATFEIDEKTMRRAGARVSSKLLRVGMRVSLSDK